MKIVIVVTVSIFVVLSSVSKDWASAMVGVGYLVELNRKQKE